MEYFVSFDTVLKLEKKGYKGKTIRYHGHIYDVLKWLREEKNIFVVTFIADDSDTPLTYEIYMGTECLLTHHGKYFTLQEWDKCNLVGIEYVIDNLI